MAAASPLTAVPAQQSHPLSSPEAVCPTALLPPLTPHQMCPKFAPVSSLSWARHGAEPRKDIRAISGHIWWAARGVLGLEGLLLLSDSEQVGLLSRNSCKKGSCCHCFDSCASTQPIAMSATATAQHCMKVITWKEQHAGFTSGLSCHAL